ncbi:MAG: F0F1 ATP synthase subunit epsilon [Gammaproteobacteria bacterium]|nr:F0F1 ATP synthase subunit epsilon [Gammaproteobacteria bacterium]NIR30354.1 F0F1 ATP synthase subunit epsilon [Gammaproteobacteria bacterium]NIR98198.1 F0F1 ATP synthase subunit epsilon [Gammaproteobacteria bacterium]NIT63865.1 F0F1 ATP synthase subunit epsilon [Gammaproteobacteria bacterium]NIV20869.1 F0F1 ATP synthase subunit epsilon [Gammaproteobacteria bacterium]
MHLKLLLPTEVSMDEPVVKVIAEAENGAFCLLPRHVDFVAALVPGILVCETEAGTSRFFAVDEGTLVKCGGEVMVSTLNAVEGADLGALKDTVDSRFRELDEHERMARTALARLEAGTIRRFMEMEEQWRG